MPGRMDGYIRVSVVGGRAGERFQSPSQQRESIQAWATANGIEIAAWHEDLDQSGGTMDRPGMNEVLRRVDKGLTGGVVVARLDRFARTVIGGLTTIQTLDAKGARVVSVAESIDPATPMGRAMLGLLLIMAEWQRDQANEHLAAAQHRASAAGRFPGKPAFGYRRTPEGATVIDHERAVTVRRIFEARAEGKGWRTICGELAGTPTANGKTLWAASTIVGIVQSEAYLGTFIGPRGLRVENAWEPIIDADTWRIANSRKGVRDDSRTYQDRLLAGIARCAWCRYVLVRQVNPEGFVSYGCNTRGCERRTSMGAALLDSYVGGLVDQMLAATTIEPRPADDGAEAKMLLAARDVASSDLEQWRDDLEIKAALGEQDWRAGLLARARARDDAETALAEFRARGGLSYEDALPEGVPLQLESFPWEVKRRIVEAVLHSVWVRPSSARGPAARRLVARRVRVVWNDDLRKPDLPSAQAASLAPLTW